MTFQVFCVWDSGMRIRLWLVENQKFDFLTCLDYDTYLEKETATHSTVLAWRIPGTWEPGGLPSMGSHRVRHN